jgi:hypothetical protein
VHLKILAIKKNIWEYRAPFRDKNAIKGAFSCAAILLSTY